MKNQQAVLRHSIDAETQACLEKGSKLDQMIEYLNRNTSDGKLDANCDIELASKLIDRCGRLVERIHSAQRAGQVSMGAVMKLQEGMALVVLQELQRALPTREAADEVAKRIADRWDGLVVEGT